MSSTIMIVDDDSNWLFAAECLLKDKYNVLKSPDKQSCLRNLKQEQVHLIILDLGLPGVREYELLCHIKKCYSSIPVIILTARNDIRTAITAMQSGADDYVTKEDAEELLLRSVRKNLENQVLKNQIAGFQAELQSRTDTFIPSHPVYQQVYRMAEKYVQHGVSNICIEGETGTGKTMIVEYLRNTFMPGKPMIAENCANFTASIADSLLMGHERGAFTGADKQQKGKFELANGGILFLDEIGNMPLEVQEKVLCALRDKKIKRLGGEKEIPVDFLLITATNTNLKKAVETGSFRKDLYYRINQAKLHMPCFRDHPEVIPEYMGYFVDYFNRKLNKDFVASKAFISYILSQPWDGNVAELKSCIELLIQFHPDDCLLKNLIQSVEGNKTVGRLSAFGSLREKVDMFERNEIAKALEINSGNLSKAARELNTPLSTLQSKIKKLGVENIRKGA